MNKKQKSDKNYIIDAVIMLCVGITFLLILVGVFGRSGKVVTEFLVGSLGYAVYGYCVGLILFAVLKLCKFKPKLNAIKVVSMVSGVVMFLALLHVISSNRFVVADTTYTQYLLNCYNNPVTAGGIVGATFIYPILKLNYIFAVVITAILTIVSSGVVIFTQFDTKIIDRIAKRGKDLEINDLNTVDVETKLTQVGDDMYIFNGNESFRRKGRKSDMEYVSLDSQNESHRQVITKDILNATPKADDDETRRAELRRDAINVLFNNDDKSDVKLDAVTKNNNTVNAPASNTTGDTSSNRSRLIDRLAKRKAVPSVDNIEKVTPNAQDNINTAKDVSVSNNKDYFDIDNIIVNKQDSPNGNILGLKGYKPLVDSLPQGSEKYEDVWTRRSREKREQENLSNSTGSRQNYYDNIDKLNVNGANKQTNNANDNAYSNESFGQKVESLNGKVGNNNFDFNFSNDKTNASAESVNKTAENLYSEAKDIFDRNADREKQSNNAQNNVYDAVSDADGDDKWVNDLAFDTDDNTQEQTQYKDDVIVDTENIDNDSDNQSSEESFDDRSRNDIDEIDDVGYNTVEPEENADELTDFDYKFEEDAPTTSRNTHDRESVRRDDYRRDNNRADNANYRYQEKENVSRSITEVDNSRYVKGEMGKDGSIEIKRQPYKFPPIDLLAEYPPVDADDADLQAKTEILESTLATFNINAKVVNIVKGPVFCRFELQMPQGVSVNKIKPYENDIAMCLEAGSIRCQIPIPNKNAFGVEIPNVMRGRVGMRSMLLSREFQNNRQKLSVVLGQDCEGKNYIVDLTSLCHVLVAGSTGAGKSVCLNTFICSLMYKYTPEDVRLILVDPKQIEFYTYDGLPHLLLPKAINTPAQCLSALDWAIEEMERRFLLIKNVRGARDIFDYNNNRPQGVEKLPYLIIIIDELGDLMSVVKKDIEERIIRLTQKARASGIIMILATQRPSVDVITGVIKGNLPSRIAFAVPSPADSTTILGQAGAEKLLRYGDMLFSDISVGQLLRIQGALITGDEVSAVCDYIRANNESHYDEDIVETITKPKPKPDDASSSSRLDRSEEMEHNVEIATFYCLKINYASASAIQRRIKVGYNKAASIIEIMEERGYISKDTNAQNRRKMLVTLAEIERIYGKEVGS